MQKCSECGKILTVNEKGLSAKLLGMTSEKMLCRQHLMEYYKVDDGYLDGLIEFYQARCCQLFEPKN